MGDFNGWLQQPQYHIAAVLYINIGFTIESIQESEQPEGYAVPVACFGLIYYKYLEYAKKRKKVLVCTKFEQFLVLGNTNIHQTKSQTRTCWSD